MASRFATLKPALASAACLIGAGGGTSIVLALYMAPATWLPGLALTAALLLLTLALSGPLLRSPGPGLLAELPTAAVAEGRALLDAGGVLLEADPGLVQVLRQPLQRLLQQPLRSLLPEAVWTELLKRAQRQRDSRGSILLETDLEPAHGSDDTSTRRLRCVFEPHRSPRGELLWALTVTDISAQRAEQAGSLERQALFERALQEASEFSFRLAPSGQILATNPHTRKQFGWRAEDPLPTLTSITVGPVAALEAKLADAAKSDHVLHLKQLHLRLPAHADAESRVLELNAHLQRLPGARASVELLLSGSDQAALLRRQRKLRSRNQRLESIYQNHTAALILFRDSDGQVLDCNPAASELLGYDLKTLTTASGAAQRLWSSELERQSAEEQLAANGVLLGLRATLRHADGHPIAAELDLSAIEVSGETCTLLCGRDLSDQLQTEERLRNSEAKFQHMFQSSPDAITIIRARDGQFMEVNPAAGTLLGYPRGALIGRSCFDSDFNPFTIEAQTLFEATDAETSLEDIELKARNGTRLPALVARTLIKLDGELHLLAICRDLRELKGNQQRLQQVEARFRGAFDNAQLALLLVDMDGRIFETNSYARDMLSFTEAQFQGLHVSRLVPAEDRTRLKAALSELRNRGHGNLRNERRLLCQNGLELWTSFQVVLQEGSRSEDAYFIIQAADITDIKVSQRRMERMAFYDTLTDLANRRLFADRLRQAVDHAQRSSGHAALLYLDLDQFKRVNDTLSHEAGDMLLQEVAHRLGEYIRQEDTVGRLGGDEFTVLLYDVQHSGDAGIVAAKILRRLSEPMRISGHDLVISASIGITVIPEDGVEPAVLMKNADLAMYRAKERGRNNYQFFSEDMNAKASRLLRTENELRQGLERSEFVLYHQPKYRIEDGTLGGVECLVRWQHPERGLVGPGDFIDVAEETGAIVPLGSWIIEAACAAAKLFADLSQRQFVTAVNISPRQFRDPNLVNTIRRCLRTYDLPPERLQVEITETMLMQDIAAAELTVARLHELGIQLAIDDFGTGYSSLNYLKRFPINTVKVDRSFVKDIPGSEDDCAITAAVIAMAHRLHMEVVAEGVETDEQIEFLRQLGCEYAQGFHYGKPVPLEALRLTIQRDNLKHAPKTLVGT